MSASEPTTPVVTRDQLTEANSHTIMETPGQVPSEDESEDDDRCDPDFVLTSMQHATASDSEDSYVEKPMQWQTPSDDDATPRASRLNLEGSTQEAGEVLGSQTTQTASKTNVVGKGKGKGKEKEKAPKIWEMIKATRREKDLVRNATC